jgi:hypothetical protein
MIVTKDAGTVVDRFTKANMVHQLRPEWKQVGDAGGDMVFENAVLFLRDSLLLKEFTDAMKGGDSGYVLLVLMIWVCSFQGQGHLKYVQEMLYFLHNITHLWPPALW